MEKLATAALAFRFAHIAESEAIADRHRHMSFFSAKLAHQTGVTTSHSHAAVSMNSPLAQCS